MADTLALDASAERRVGSTPTLRTRGDRPVLKGCPYYRDGGVLPLSPLRTPDDALIRDGRWVKSSIWTVSEGK
jgi:hypothetical protein